MITLTFPDSSREYVTTTVGAPAGVTVENYDVEIAIVARNAAVEEGDWNTAAWEPGSPGVARLLVGPGSSLGALVPGAYSIWVRLDTGVEEPVRRAGFLVITPTE